MIAPVLDIHRTLRIAAAMPPAQARKVVGMLIRLAPPALVCGARVAPHRQLAARHFALREPAIARLRDAIVRHLDHAKHETLRNIEGHFANDETRMTNVEGKAHSIRHSPFVIRHSPSPLVAAGVGIDLIFDLATWAEGLLATVRSELAQTLQTAGEQAMHEFRFDDPFSMPDPRVLEFLDARENQLSETADSIHRTIMDELKAGVEAGESRAKLSRRITSEFDNFSESRADTIASTETGIAYGTARQDAMQQAGVGFKRWLTSHLPTVRAAHEMAENDARNQRVPIDQPFISGGEELMFPGDPSGSPENIINCHCVALPVE